MMKFARNPFVLAALAAALILAVFSFAGRNMNRNARQEGAVEAVSVSKRIVVNNDAIQRAPDGLAVSAPTQRVYVHSQLKGQPPRAEYAQGAPAPVATPSPQKAGNIAQPQIARTGKVSLFVSNIERAVNTVTRIAREQGGDVFSSTVDNGGGNDTTPSSAEMEIRVPSQHFEAAMGGVTTFGKVREHSISAEDLSADITDSDARLRNLRRTESDILKIMDRSGSVAQIMDVENQLSQVREQIETLESELKAMRGRVSYSTISISMQAEVAAAPAERTLGSQLVTAWNEAAHSFGLTLVGIAAFVLWLIVYLPLAAALAAVLYAVRVAVRRYQRSRSMA